MVAVLLAALLATEPLAPPSPAPAESVGPRPALLRDVALAAAASMAVAGGKADIRRAILRDGRFRNVLENFTHPVSQVRIGTRRDTDPFWINGIAHPMSFAAEALYLKRQGYSDGGAFLFTQAHSVLWEFVVEGCAFEPSGKDLLADAAGAAAAIWILHPLTRKLWGPRPPPLELSVVPARGGGQVRLTATF